MTISSLLAHWLVNVNNNISQVFRLLLDKVGGVNYLALTFGHKSSHYPTDFAILIVILAGISIWIHKILLFLADSKLSSKYIYIALW